MYTSRLILRSPFGLSPEKQLHENWKCRPILNWLFYSRTPPTLCTTVFSLFRLTVISSKFFCHLENWQFKWVCVESTFEYRIPYRSSVPFLCVQINKIHKWNWYSNCVCLRALDEINIILGYFFLSRSNLWWVCL